MRSENQNFNLNQYIKGILSGDRATLSRAITLRESTLPEHKLLSEKLLKSLIKHTGNSIRIGVTGIPGAGKSTFCDLVSGKTKTSTGKVFFDSREMLFG